MNTVEETDVSSSSDYNAGYWKMLMKKEDRYKTAFSSQQGLYQFARMYFLLRNASDSFQYSIDIMLALAHFKVAMVYLDDIIIFSHNIDGHFYNMTWQELCTASQCFSLRSQNYITYTLTKYWLAINIHI